MSPPPGSPTSRLHDSLAPRSSDSLAPRLPGSLAPLLAFLTSLLLLAGCASFDPNRIAERSIARYLRGYLGPANRYQVHIDRKGSRVTGGYISHLVVAADKIQTAGGLQVDRLDADLYGVQFDPRKRTLQNVERSAFTASVGEDSANAYLSVHNRGIPDLSVEFEPGTIVVHAAPKILGIAIPLTLRGQGDVESGNRIGFHTDALAVSRLNIPQAAIRLVESRVNPVFDLDELKLPANLESIESRQDELILRGQVRF